MYGPPRDVLDWDALARYLHSEMGLEDELVSVFQFTSGRANLTYLLDFGTNKLVLRRPPNGTIAPGAHDMKREYRVLSRLNSPYPRAPLALHYCADPSVIGAEFVVSEYRQGEVLAESIPASMAGHPDVERRVDLALLDAAADLHRVDVAGFEDLGRPSGFGDRQVSGWADRWRRAAPETDIPAMEETARLLAATVPAPQRTAVVHNDFKLDNCQFDPDDPDTVKSVFDWDMATVGDPLFDLGALLVTMGRSPMWTVTLDESLDRYSAKSGLDVENVNWYLAFATWRTAVVVQQLYRRFMAGDSTDERLLSMGKIIPDMADRALDMLTANR